MRCSWLAVSFLVFFQCSSVDTSAPDLVLEDLVVSPSEVNINGEITISVSVKNDGSVNARGTSIRYYRSFNENIDSKDQEELSKAVLPLATGATDSFEVKVTAPEIAGMYYYGACVASPGDEIKAGNNCTSGAMVSVVNPNSEIVASL